MQKSPPIDPRDGDEKGKLFVGGLSWETTHSSMLKYFDSYGDVIDCVVMKNQNTGKSRGFGFVKFRDPQCVDAVLQSGPHMLDGRQVDPKACNPRSMNKGPKTPEMKNKNKVFLGGLPANVTETLIREAFELYGQVNDVVIMFDQQKQRSRGFGFLSFEQEDSVDRVCQQQYVQVAGKKVECKKAEPRDLKMLQQSIMLGQMPHLSFLGANGQLVPAGSMFPGAGLTSAAFPSSAYTTGGIFPPTAGGLLLPAAAPLTLPLTLTGGFGGALHAGAMAAHNSSAVLGGSGGGGGAGGWPSGDGDAYMFTSQCEAPHMAGPAGGIRGPPQPFPGGPGVPPPGAVFLPPHVPPPAVTAAPPYHFTQPTPHPSNSASALTGGAAIAGYSSPDIAGYIPSPTPTGSTTPTPQGSDAAVVSEKAGYLLYSGQAAALGEPFPRRPMSGMLGSYPQEASTYGPTRGYSPPEALSSAATPTSLSTAATALAQLHAAGGYGALSNGFGQTLVPLAAYGGQGDGSGITYTNNTALANARAVATAGFHPYRR